MEEQVADSNTSPTIAQPLMTVPTPWYKKWWLWVIFVIVILGAVYSIM